jgi:hypothetical protein
MLDRAAQSSHLLPTEPRLNFTVWGKGDGARWPPQIPIYHLSRQLFTYSVLSA